MSNQEEPPESEQVERRAVEFDLVAHLSPNKSTQAKAKANAERLRELLKRVRARDPEQ